MIVRLADPTAAPVLVDPASFTGFHVEAPGATESEVAAALTGLGEVVDGHAFLTPDAIRTLAGTAADEEWEQGFAAMVAYATGKGWIDERGRIRAHLELGTAT
jgi:hypothetical protein